MVFNSIEFLIFFPIVFFLYWGVFKKKNQTQNFLLLVASYLFYGWWDYRFLGLLVFTTIVDYFLAIQIHKTHAKKRKRLFLAISLLMNLGILLFFKYANFFISSWVDAWSLLHIKFDLATLKIVLPIGVSFYTFQELSYTIDVYYGRMKPARNFINFSSCISFFPVLVAGPIERVRNLLPQFEKPRVFSSDLAVKGGRLILWGMFKKVVVGDNCAIFSNYIFANPNQMPFYILFLGAIYFSFQIYCDFSGYSDIAIGTARLLGFEIMLNFKKPYFSRNIAEFWRRWHISLSSWFRDYIYFPLGGSKVGKVKGLRNILIIFLVSGFWHGASWTFITWGLLHAIYYIPSFLSERNRTHLDSVAEGKMLPSLKELGQMFGTYFLVCFAWIFFRAATMRDALEYVSRMLLLQTVDGHFVYLFKGLLPVIVFLLIEWLNRTNYQDGIFALYPRFPKPLLAGIEIVLGLLILDFATTLSYQQFIYFQF
jgi:alginate O-acetyltransferase complex protein AlgI